MLYKVGATTGGDLLGPAGGLTTGSVLFVDSSGNVSQDNANFFWDDTNNRLGIGTNAPTRSLDILDAVNPQLRLKFSASFYTDFQTDSGGNLQLKPVGGQFGIQQGFTGGENIMFVYNTATTNGASNALISVISGGVNAGDPYIRTRVVGGQSWSLGVDNSDSDKFKIANNDFIHTNTYITIAPTTGLVGLNIDTPLARVHAHEATLGNPVSMFTSTATNDDPNVAVIQGRVATTDATVTTLATLALTASRTYWLRAVVTARRTGGAAGIAEDGAGYVLTAVYKTVAGVATQIGTASMDFTAEDQAGWNVTFTSSGTNVLVRVTGAASNNITWHTTLTYSYTGT